MLRRAVYFFIFLAIVAENPADDVYNRQWSTFMEPVGDFLFRNLPIKIPPIDFLILGLFLAAFRSPGARTHRARAFDRTVYVCLASLLLPITWGLATGGDPRQVFWQMHQLMMVPVLTLVFSWALRMPRDLRGLGQAVVGAALYRALMAVIFRFVVVPGLPVKPPHMTTHSDTMLFVLGLVIFLSRYLEKRTLKNLVLAVGLGGFLALAILINNRRLAYVSVAVSGAVLYAIFPAGRAKRVVNYAVLAAIPLLVAYLAAGWESSATIFKPARSFATMVGHDEDSSSATRNIENFNLLQTWKRSPILGTGWGHEYDEVNVAYSIAEAFPQYRYIPHNSALGLWAFTGLLGATGVWSIFSVGIFFGVRTYRAAKNPEHRTAAAAAVCMILAYLLQAYGDMGFASWTGAVLMAASLATVNRLSVAVGAWSRTARAAHKLIEASGASRA